MSIQSGQVVISAQGFLNGFHENTRESRGGGCARTAELSVVLCGNMKHINAVGYCFFCRIMDRARFMNVRALSFSHLFLQMSISDVTP